MAEGTPGSGAMPLSQWLLLLLLAVIWGSTYMLLGLALRELPPMTIVMLRLGLAAMVMAALVWAWRLTWPRSLSDWMPFLVMGILNNVIPFIAIGYSQLEIASGLTSVIVATTPLWTLLLSRAFVPGQRIGGLQIAGILFGIVGVGVLFGPEMLAGKRTTLFGMMLALLAAVSYGCAGAWGARLRGVQPVVSTSCQLACSALVMTVVAVALDKPWTLPMPGWLTVTVVLVLAVVSTALAYVVFYRVLAVSGGTNAMLVTLIMPPISIWLGILVLDETFTVRYALGALIIAAGLVVIDGRLPRAVARRLAG